ncbi:hypothetical protein [Sodalis sp. dw_96]|uniref:hypothetical protein n=1 Tax=Sodalis sp. dw_96 TaxID=2719794 RepID=UPI001BD4A14D|nr:hypothetical protein [Sodalis sp. dw_96]
MKIQCLSCPRHATSMPLAFRNDPGSACRILICKVQPLNVTFFDCQDQSNAAILSYLRYNAVYEIAGYAADEAFSVRELSVALYKAAVLEVKFRTILKWLTTGQQQKPNSIEVRVTCR